MAASSAATGWRLEGTAASFSFVLSCSTATFSELHLQLLWQQHVLPHVWHVFSLVRGSGVVVDYEEEVVHGDCGEEIEVGEDD